jgi:hypothetical protein
MVAAGHEFYEKLTCPKAERVFSWSEMAARLTAR